MPVTEGHTEDAYHQISYAEVHNQHVGGCVKSLESDDDGDDERVSQEGEDGKGTVEEDGCHFAAEAEKVELQGSRLRALAGLIHEASFCNRNNYDNIIDGKGFGDKKLGVTQRFVI